MAQDQLTDDLDFTEKDDTIDLRDYLRVIIKRRRQILTVWGLVVAACLIYCFIATPIYQATVSIIIDKQPTADPGSLQEAVFNDTSDTEYYQTVENILLSRTVAYKVIKQLNLDKNEDFFSQDFDPNDPNEDSKIRMERMIDAFLQKDLTIDMIPKSHFFNINFRIKDKVLAAAVANALVDAYREHALAMKLDSVQNSVVWLTSNLEQERKKVEASQRALLQYEEANGIVTDFSTSTETMTSQKLAQLISRGVDAEAARAQAEVIYKQAAALSVKADMVDAIPEVLENDLIRMIKTQEVALLQRRSELSKRYGENHPEMVALQSELKTLQAKKNQEVQRIIDALRNTWQAALAHENALKEALAVQKNEAFNLNRTSIIYTGLYCEAEGSQAMYALLLKRLKETSITENLNVGNIRIVDKANKPYIPVRPKLLLYTFLASILGLVVSLGIAFTLEYLDDAVNVPEDITGQVRIPYLGSVPLSSPKDPVALAYEQGEPPLPPFLAARLPRSNVAEAYRSIRTNLLLSMAETEPQVIMVSSAEAVVGKTTTACNIAVVLAHFGYRVALLDCDLHRPQLQKLFDIKQEAGMSNLLVGSKKMPDAVFTTDIPNLDIIPSGPIPPNPSEMLGSRKMKTILNELRQQFDKIIIDAPPTGAVTDPLVMAKFTDGVVLVALCGKTSRRSLAHAAENLKKIGAHVFGAVINAVNIRGSGYYHYYHFDYKYGPKYKYGYGTNSASGRMFVQITRIFPFVKIRGFRLKKLRFIGKFPFIKRKTRKG